MAETYQEFIEKYKVSRPPVKTKKQEKPWYNFLYEDPEWLVKHPNLYGVYGAAKGIAEGIGKVGFPKYADPNEIKKLSSLPPEQQRQQLLMDTLESVSMIAFGARSPKAPKISKQTQRVATEVIEEKTAPDFIGRIQSAVRKAKPLRKEQEKLYTLERKKRLGKAKQAGESLTGEARAKAETKALGGEMPKVEFEPLKIAQQDADAAFNLIKQKIPDFYRQKTAERGLWKIFDGAVPQESELAQLRKVFPQRFIKDLLKKRSLFKRMKELGHEAINVPKAVMASFDLSAPLRQGIFLGPKHPIRFTQSFLKMFRQFGSEKAYRAVQESLTQKKWYNLLREEGLAVTEIEGGLANREEAYIGAQLAEKIPLIGRGIRASNRAYTGFLNKLRVDVGNDLVEKAFKAGLDPENNPVLTKAITKFINAGSGRGNLWMFEKYATDLNSVFFSPRLMGSRITLLNPMYYIKQPAFVRKEALKSLFAFTGAIGTTLGFTDKVPGITVGKDPRSANFGKIIIGNTRLDIMGGFQQYIRAAAQFYTKTYISSTTGKEYTLGEGYKPMTRKDILERVVSSKFAPPARFAYDLMQQQDPQGRPISVPKEIGIKFVPMVMQDVYDLSQEEPDLLPLVAFGVFGVGLQTYGPRPPKLTGMGGLGSLEGIGGI